MLDLTLAPDVLLDPIVAVLDAALPHMPDVHHEDVMIVGAVCRDVLHHALGHEFPTTATSDLDLALALSSWDAFRALAETFPRIGDSGIRFRIAGVYVDVLPFGAIEDPTGTTTPPTRQDAFSVWAFEEIFGSAVDLTLPTTNTVRLPTVAGYAAAKLAAWLDRSSWFEFKDARDLALAVHWYDRSPAVRDRIYETTAGERAFHAEREDASRAAAHLLGTDIAETIGPHRLGEIMQRWPGDVDVLEREFLVGHVATSDSERRREMIAALTAGLRGPTAR